MTPVELDFDAAWTPLQNLSNVFGNVDPAYSRWTRVLETVKYCPPGIRSTNIDFLIFLTPGQAKAKKWNVDPPYLDHIIFVLQLFEIVTPHQPLKQTFLNVLSNIKNKQMLKAMTLRESKRPATQNIPRYYSFHQHF